jgi:hypothetical protein
LGGDKFALDYQACGLAPFVALFLVSGSVALDVMSRGLFGLSSLELKD